jgi:hypothetical protein
VKSLRLRPGLHYAPIEGGVYFSSARATFVMQGPALLFRVVDVCVPLLEDGTDIDQLVATIGAPAARPLIDHLIKTFDARGLLLHLHHLAVPEPGPVERERFPEALAYLETFCDDPYAAFLRIRKARVLLSGPPEALGPAARGLVRAGLGQVLVATTEPERLAGLASRHPEVRLLLCPHGVIPLLVSRYRPQAAVIFTEDSFPAEALRRVPATCIAIPVRLGKDLAIVGPALVPGDDARGAMRLWSRAASWSGLDGDDPLVRPSSDLLAGALAGQVALDAMIGHDRGRIHLIHGPDLTSDSITPSLSAESEYDPPVELGGPDHQLAPSIDGDAGATEWWAPLSREWSGLFRVTVPGDLPQLPLSLTVADGVNNCFDGRAVGFGPDQQASTAEAGFEVLRHHCAGLARYQHQCIGPPTAGAGDRRSVAAAGLDETRWLLDGALRLLAGLPGEPGDDERPVDWTGIEDVEAGRLWRALEDHERTPVQLSSRRVRGFGWTLVSAHDRREGSLLARAWGPTPEVGAQAALSAAIARQQVRRTVDPGYEAAVSGPGYIEHLHGAHGDQLVAEVTAWLSARGGHIRGQRLRRDTTTGLLEVCCGMVWLDE